jgi:3-deoxy-manno-octulosonate cytidylyltransferase (CMP-KDO synthetase)
MALENFGLAPEHCHWGNGWAKKSSGFLRKNLYKESFSMTVFNPIPVVFSTPAHTQDAIASENLTPIIIIPSRMGSVRLPNKPMAMIHGEPMIVHVWRRACETKIAPVVVACDHPEIASAIRDAGGQAVITDTHATGSDRLAQAMDLVDPDEHHNIIINIQGDLPLFPPAVVASILGPFQMNSIDMTTFIQPHDPRALGSVKVRVQPVPVDGNLPWLHCQDFTRNSWDSPYSHLGIYAFRRGTLKQFAQWPQTDRERAESLEQLRVLDRGVTIAGVLLENKTFLCVDTLDDLIAARAQIAP